jgi:hypothetical protein
VAFARAGGGRVAHAEGFALPPGKAQCRTCFVGHILQVDTANFLTKMPTSADSNQDFPSSGECNQAFTVLLARRSRYTISTIKLVSEKPAEHVVET